jgi:hypothetical protein
MGFNLAFKGLIVHMAICDKLLSAELFIFAS